MKLSAWSTFFISSIFIMLAVSATLSTKDYINLISDVYNLYKRSSLTLIYFIDHQDSSQMNTIFNMQMLLSRERIMTITLKLEQGILPNEYIRSLRRSKQPMNVIFISSERDVNKMKDLQKVLSFYGTLNLVLFVKVLETPSIEFCLNPVRNPFLQSEGVSFLVKCSENIALREWYALNRDQLRIYERITWEPTTRLVIKSKKLLQTDQDILNGKVLCIGLDWISEKFDKYFDDLFLALQYAGNFTTKMVKPAEDGIGSLNVSSKTWSGLMGLTENHEIDILAPIYIFDEKLLNSADLTQSINKFDLCLYIRKPTPKVRILWSGYFKAFSYKTWCALIGSLIVTVTLLTFLRLKVEKGSYNGTIHENFLHVWGCYLQQGLPEFPTALTLRLFYYSIFLFGFLVWAIYSASFVSELTLLEENLPFKSFKEFLTDTSYKLAVLSSSTYNVDARDPLWKTVKEKYIKRNQAPKNEQEALNLICSEKVALLNIDFFTSLLSEGTKIPCSLVKVNLQEILYFYMAMPKNSPYKKAINYYIMKLSEDGILKRIGSELKDSVSEIPSINAPTEQKFYPATILDIASLLAMVFGSVVLSLLILFFEKVYFIVRKRKSIQISIISRPRAARIRKIN